MDETVITIQVMESGERIDALLARSLEETSRSAAQKLLLAERVWKSGKVLKKNYVCQAGDVLEIRLPPAREIAVVPQDIPLEIVYEDDDLIVVNKPRY